MIIRMSKSKGQKSERALIAEEDEFLKKFKDSDSFL